MTRVRIEAKRATIWFVTLSAGTAVSMAAVLAYPQPLFPYHVALGRLEIRSDAPFNAESGLNVLRDIDARLRKTSLDTGTETHRVVVVNAQWRARLTFLWNYGAGGVNYYPLTRNVFVRSSDIDVGLVRRPSSGEFVPAPRTLAYYGAHEIGHSLTAARVGILAYRKLPVWIREGVADYIGFGGVVDVASLAKQLKDGHPDLDPDRSGLYARYRLLVAYLVTTEGWSIEKVIADAPRQIEVESALLADYRLKP